MRCKVVVILVACSAIAAILVTVWHLRSQSRFSGPLHVYASVSQSRYLLGAPVPVKLDVSNCTAGPLWLASCLGRNDYLQVYVARDGQPFREMFHWRLCGITDEPVPLQPSETWHYSFQVLLPLDEYPGEEAKPRLVFDEPGLYQMYFRVRLIHPYNVESVSNRIALRIVGPQGRDADLWRKLDRPDILLLVAGNCGGRSSDRSLKEARREVESFLKEYPESSYRDILQAALARKDVEWPWLCKEDVE
jgi:hypothetical protein